VQASCEPGCVRILAQVLERQNGDPHLPLTHEQNIATPIHNSTGRGSWQVELDTGATLELGRGDVDEVAARVQRFVQTLTHVAGRYGRQPEALVSADLRYGHGYAIPPTGVGPASRS
jgi:cell division protein FtsQ